MSIQYKMNFEVTDELENKVNESILERYYNNDRSYDVFHPSTIGGCLRKPVFDALYITSIIPTERTMRIFDNGHSVHERLEKYFDDSKILVEAELVLEDKKLNLRGRTDALIFFQDQYCLVEIKSCKAKSFSYSKRFNKLSDSYYLQLQLYLHIVNKIYKETYGIIKVGYIVVENKNDQTWMTYKISYDRKLGEQLEEKIVYLNRCIGAGVLPKVSYEKRKFPCSWAAGSCDYYDFCYNELPQHLQ